MKVLPILLFVICLLGPSTGVRRQLTEAEVARAVQFLEFGKTQRAVAVHFDVSGSVINRLWRRFQEDGLYTRRPGKGRRRVTTPPQDRYLRILARRNLSTISCKILSHKLPEGN